MNDGAELGSEALENLGQDGTDESGENKIPSMAAVNTSIPEAQQDFKKERALFRAYSRTKRSQIGLNISSYRVL